jgi:NAD(P)-dependent dehydrogenase (short-subunit alcohol dehydrogenase family)
MDRRVVLITGASSGIGQACAVHLSGRGFRVYGASRTPAAAVATFPTLAMDVADDASVERGVASLLEREGRIDILVNNAGIALAGPLESTSLDEARRQFDVNFFAAIRLCRAVLPSMRRQGGGYIVNVSSIGGLIAIPFQPMYSASKFALEGLTEGLRLEVRPFGIRVVLVEPGDTRTPLTQHRTFTADAATREQYGSCAAAVVRMAQDEQQGPGPESVARLVERIVNTPRPRLRYTAGPAVQRAAVWLKRLLPNALLEFGMRRYYGLGL